MAAPGLVAVETVHTLLVGAGLLSESAGAATTETP